ncbi:MAG TPA: hypothetical protein VL306_01405 [Methylomirabilota bacterium]|nr:hypothetical protein [Methylomirabilota bacterium]
MEDQIFDEKTRADLPPDLNSFQTPPESFFSKYKVIIISALAVIIGVGVFWYVISSKSTSSGPQSKSVAIVFKGPDQITSGNEAEYTITYRNGENADLVGVSLQLLYPAGFKFKSATPAPTASSGTSFNLPILKSGQDGSVVIRGNLSGGTNEDKEIKALLHYRLSNFNSEFEVSQSKHTVIQAPNLLLDISGPVDAVNGQDMTFTVTVTNVSGQSFQNQAVQLTYPEGFTYTSASPSASRDNNYWLLGPLASGNSQSLEVTGSFAGADMEQKLVRADLGQIINNNFAPQISATASFRLIPASVSLSVEANPKEYIKPGDTVTYKVHYANRGSIGLSNLVVTVNLDSPAVDYARIQANNAIITGHTLTWKSATLSNLSLLSPNEQGEIDFTVPVKDTFSTNLKNETIVAAATISSDEINNPTRAVDNVVKIISTLGLSVDGDYVSGAAPLAVGQTTVFAITMTLVNGSNDLSGAEVIASMPLPSSAWNNVIIPESEKSRLSFDPNSGKIKWKVGDLAAFTGKFIPALKVTFQLAVTPADSDRGKSVTLLNDVQVTGTDTFVDQSIQSEVIKNITTSSIDDPVINQQGGGSVQ